MKKLKEKGANVIQKEAKAWFCFFFFQTLLNVQAAERASLINWISAGKHLNYRCGADTLGPLIQGDIDSLRPGRKLQLLARCRLQLHCRFRQVRQASCLILDVMIFNLGWTVC